MRLAAGIAYLTAATTLGFGAAQGGIAGVEYFKGVGVEQAADGLEDAGHIEAAEALGPIAVAHEHRSGGAATSASILLGLTVVELGAATALKRLPR
jgi:hypothetical protein